MFHINSVSEESKRFLKNSNVYKLWRQKANQIEDTGLWDQ